jgi:hypothetical protein
LQILGEVSRPVGFLVGAGEEVPLVGNVIGVEEGFEPEGFFAQVIFFANV